MDPEGTSREPANSEKEWLISAVRTLSRIVAGKEKGQEKIWNIECKPDWWNEKTGGLPWRNPTGNRKDSLQVLQKKYRVLEEYVKAEKRFPESLQKEAELWSTNQFDKLFAFTHLIYFYNEAKKLATVWEKFIKLYPGKDGSLDAEFSNYFKNCKASFKEIQHKMTEYTEQLSPVHVKQTRPNDSRESTPPTPAVVSSESSYNSQASMSALPKLQRKRSLENVQVNHSEKRRKTQSKTNAPTQSSTSHVLHVLNTPTTLDTIYGDSEAYSDKIVSLSPDEGFSDGFHLEVNNSPRYSNEQALDNFPVAIDHSTPLRNEEMFDNFPVATDNSTPLRNEEVFDNFPVATDEFTPSSNVEVFDHFPVATDDSTPLRNEEMFENYHVATDEFTPSSNVEVFDSFPVEPDDYPRYNIKQALDNFPVEPDDSTLLSNEETNIFQNEETHNSDLLPYNQSDTLCSEFSTTFNAQSASQNYLHPTSISEQSTYHSFIDGSSTTTDELPSTNALNTTVIDTSAMSTEVSNNESSAINDELDEIVNTMWKEIVIDKFVPNIDFSYFENL